MKFFSSFFGATVSGPIERALDTADVAHDVGPWRALGPRAIGGLTAAGFSRTRDDLLVTSDAGQTIIDATTGNMIYRNDGDDGLDIDALKGTRLDHPAEERFDMAGRYGGALRTFTSDGWSVDVIGKGDLAFPVLHPPGASIHALSFELEPAHRDARFHLLARAEEPLRVFGFSWTGRSLVLATSEFLWIWTRPAPLALG